MEQPSPEQQREQLDDNARKFVTEPLTTKFLEKYGAIAYELITDWLETAEESEKKIVCKSYGNGDVQRLCIAKVTRDGSRTSEKEKITEDEYNALLEQSLVHVEKWRYEFDYTQGDRLFTMKYDEFANSDLRILEVDAETDEIRNIFDSGDYPVRLAEVTGDLRYYGYRVSGVLY